MPSGVLKHILLFFIPLLCFSQNDSILNQRNFDSIARTKTYNGDLYLLVSQLTENCTTETEKARAIFVWITDNIAYDYRAFNKHKLPKRPKPKKGKNYDFIVAQWKVDYTDRVLRKGKAVCEGYSMLFNCMCDYAGLKTDYVPGYVKSQPNQIGRMGILDHTWNGILLDGKYYFLDATWAAGGCSTDKKGRLDGFFKNFDDFYWLTPVEKFCMDHYPEDKDNRGVAEYPVEKYKNNPYIKKSHIRQINILCPISGLIEAHLGEPVSFTFEYDQNINSIYLNTNTKRLKKVSINNSETEKYLTETSLTIPETAFTKNGNTYQFDYLVNNKNTRYIEVYINLELIMRFNIKITQ
nr:transglutaminase domain-containing protein [uncultured Flavobacterium sp.]